MKTKTQYTVRKGLETPLLIYGLRIRDFYMMVGISALLALFLLMELNAWLQGAGSLGEFGIKAAIAAAVFLGLYAWFQARAKFKKYNFKKERSYLSNRDILKYLKP